MSSEASNATRIIIDGDACPVKAEALRVAERHRLPVVIVSNGGLRPSRDPMVRHVVVARTPDAADDWIADECRSGRHRRHRRHPARGAGPERRRAGDRARRAAVHPGFHRHGRGDARPQAPSPRDRGHGERRPKLRPRRSLALSRRIGQDGTPGAEGRLGCPCRGFFEGVKNGKGRRCRDTSPARRGRAARRQGRRGLSRGEPAAVRCGLL